MPKKKSERQREAAREKARFECAAAKRDQHARLVVDRSNDPRYAHREKDTDGNVVYSWSPDTDAGQLISAGFEGQMQAFRDKFGREPGPDDPLMFDPTADTPRPMTEDNFDQMIDEAVAAADAVGIDPAYLYAWREVGYLVTEENRHTFSLAEIEVYNAAVQRHRT